jgi:hypothetical protein
MELNIFAGFAQEGFLLTLTNRGTYNRALKDYEALNGKIAIADEGGDVAVSFEDVKVILKQAVKESRCSCPARDTCKHVLIALFAARDACSVSAAEAKAEVPSAESDSYDELENAKLETLKKEAGDKTYRKALQLFSDGFGATFPPDIPFDQNTRPNAEMLAAEVTGDGVTVYFPRSKSLTGAVCKCGAKGLCVHRLVAVFSYLEKRGLFLAPAEEDSDELGASAVALLEQAVGFAVSLFEKGIISADTTDIEAAQQLSLKLDGEGIGNLSRLFRGIATDLENMLAKNTGFNHRVSFASLSRTYIVAVLILKHRSDRDKRKRLIERSRAEYRSIPQGHFIGLGAYPWQARSGYAGVSSLLYSKERKLVFTYSDSMADFYEKTKDAASIAHLKATYRKDAHWNPSVSIKAISEGKFSLKQFKVNDDMRVSSSKETLFFSEGKTTQADCALIATSPAFSSPSEPSFDYFGKRSSTRYALVLAQNIEGCFYDRTQQLLRFDLCGDETVQALIPYSEINKKAISYIEDLAKSSDFRPLWFVCQRDSRGLIPLSTVGADGIHNFYF